ncbi:MAG: DEAD/DEAH box helicase family protein [Victivallaceae bacterium]|nr:DEAD/DEAH box helicase family protein [Victivallaceae bacterium]
MSDTSQPEYIYSEKPALELFDKLDYTYKPGSELVPNTIVQGDLLENAIKKINPWISDKNARASVKKLVTTLGSSLMETNEMIYGLLTGKPTRKEFDKLNCQVKQVIDGREQFRKVEFIDWHNGGKRSDKNSYIVSNQVRFRGKERESIPDIVVYINGIPLAVIECKAPKVRAQEKAVSDLLYYQQNSERLFYYNQICVGIARNSAAVYGAIGVQEVQYSHYRDKDLTELTALLGDIPTKQDILIWNLFRKERLLDILKNFVVFEKIEGRTVKKLPRYQQLRATNKTIDKLKNMDEGGVIWHTQGSGKSLTMTYIAKKLQAEENGFKNPIILVLTDRIDLDTQISDLFVNVGNQNVHKARAVSHLKKLLANSYGGIITTTIQKFMEQDTASDDTDDSHKDDEEFLPEDQIEELTSDIQIKKAKDGSLVRVIKIYGENGKVTETIEEPVDVEELSDRDNIYVLADEAHRSQYGLLAAYMRLSLPNAKFIAFTGTPITKEEKSTLGEFYGGQYIDTYTIKESVADGNTLEILYDQAIPEIIIDKPGLDADFDEQYANEDKDRKAMLRRTACNKYKSAYERLWIVANHIVEHYQAGALKEGHKAILVCANRITAVMYRKIFEQMKAEGLHKLNTKVVISLGGKGDKLEKQCADYLDYVTPGEKVKQASKEFTLSFPPAGESLLNSKTGKAQYNDDHILIVSDMLLTGYDCPIASVMYLDKNLKEHTLLQAIARVNRTRAGKNAGFVMDYCGVADNLVAALKMFSGELVKDDVMKDYKKFAYTKLQTRHTKLIDFFRAIKVDRKQDREKYKDRVFEMLEPMDLRDSFKKLLKEFNQAMDIVLPDSFAIPYAFDFKLFNEIRAMFADVYQDTENSRIDAGESRKLQIMIDENLRASGITGLLAQPIAITDREVFADELAKQGQGAQKLIKKNATKHRIKTGLQINKSFYGPLSEVLEKAIDDEKNDRISQLELFDIIDQVNRDIDEYESELQSKGLKSPAEYAIYSEMKRLYVSEDEAMYKVKDIANDLDEHFQIVNWENKAREHHQMVKKIRKHVKDRFDGITESKEYAQGLLNTIIENKKNEQIG